MALLIEAAKRGYGRKTRTGARVWATVFPVRATELSVTLTVVGVWHTLWRAGEGGFRAVWCEILIELTI